MVDRRQEAASCNAGRTAVCRRHSMASKESKTQTIRSQRWNRGTHGTLVDLKERYDDGERMMGKLRDSNGRRGVWRAPSWQELINSYHMSADAERGRLANEIDQANTLMYVFNQAGAGVEVGCRPVAGAAGLANVEKGWIQGAK
jgi:hypothetical protein